MLVGCLVGPAGLGVRGVLLELLDAVPGVEVDSGLSVNQQAIFWEIRLPRVVLGVLVGAMLAPRARRTRACSGTRSPTPTCSASPAAPASAPPSASWPAAASGRWGSRCSPSPAACWAWLRRTRSAAGRAAAAARSVIVLAGVAVGAFFNAIQNFVQQRYDETLLSVYSWMLGRLSTDGW